MRCFCQDILQEQSKELHDWYSVLVKSDVAAAKDKLCEINSVVKQLQGVLLVSSCMIRLFDIGLLCSICASTFLMVLDPLAQKGQEPFFVLKVLNCRSVDSHILGPSVVKGKARQQQTKFVPLIKLLTLPLDFQAKRSNVHRNCFLDPIPRMFHFESYLAA